MNKYEAMFIIKPDLSEDERKALFSQVNDAIVKNGGSVASAAVWSEKRKMTFPIKKQQDGVYYLVNFSIDPAAVSKLKDAYKLNEYLLRLLISVHEKADK